MKKNYSKVAGGVFVLSVLATAAPLLVEGKISAALAKLGVKEAIAAQPGQIPAASKKAIVDPDRGSKGTGKLAPVADTDLGTTHIRVKAGKVDKLAPVADTDLGTTHIRVKGGMVDKLAPIADGDLGTTHIRVKGKEDKQGLVEKVMLKGVSGKAVSK